MYRTLGTRGSVFGVASGPYAGKERWVAFRRLSSAARTRLVDALAGRGQLAPLLRSSKTGRSLALPAALAVLASLYLLFIHGWPAAQRAPLALGYGSGGLALALLAHRRTRALSHQGTTITAGAYLFPLDIIEANADGTLHLVPLGGIREAGVVRQGSGHALVLTFKDGTTRAFPVTSERAAEAAYAALESAQSTLEKLTYGNDLADAVNLDPFFEVRVDDSWESVSAPAGGGAPARSLSTFAMFSTFCVAIALGVALFFARNIVAHRARDTERARMAAEIARLQEKLAENERQHALDDEEAARARQEIAAHPRDVRDAGVGLAAYETLAPNGEMVAIVTELVARAGKTGAGLPVYFAHTMKACVASATCAPASGASLAGMEGRVVDAFEAVLSQTIPRESLPVAIVATRPGTPSLVVEYSVSQVGDEPQAIQMVFDVKLAIPGHTEPRTFRLTMPPPSTPLTHPRDRSLFAGGEHANVPRADELVYARGFDRLYDEIYGLFFSGPPRVPLPSESQELRRTFGTPVEEPRRR